jgi:light-regulated signal transduction histidine kinase (bacteriophytochrome)
MDAQSKHYMAMITDSAKNMDRLIEGLLSFSRMGRQDLALQRVDLGSLVHDIIHELEPDIAGRKVEWRIDNLPEVRGDVSMLRRVLVNLVDNALKFTRPREQTEIEIGTEATQETETVIFVRDNGVGFDMAYADKLFGVFQRLHRVDEFEGTGIGLANVHRIIARHGGRIWAKSDLDQGTIFYIALPHKLQGVRDE